MARYRRRTSRYRRQGGSFVWQPYAKTERLVIPSGNTVGHVYSGVLPTTIEPAFGGEVFDADHTLERIRGSMSHNANTGVGSSDNLWFPFSIAGLQIPNGMNVNAIDLFDASKGDNYFLRMDAVCNANNNQDAVPNWHDVDSKGKRRFNVGDKIAWLWSAIVPSTRAVNIDCAFNFRILWKLKI